MAEDMYIDEEEVSKLGKSFETFAYDLESYAKKFAEATGAERIHDGFGVLTESEDVTSAYIELSEHMAESLGQLHRTLDAVGGGIRDNARNTRSADDEMTDMFRDGGHA
ncbi:MULTISPECIES: hypothetical protein [unclassified Streptomyces]|uniref:hypothetical protein n=1 Tax=unclassified Streptomyces TaxID=2593676 RepID=UPI00278BB455|nr:MULTISPECIES: hypothetical protein [unclassified Streptomyces]